MSQSPDEEEMSAATERYFSNWNRLGEMVSRGASFSGREQNRCFLNTMGPRFADVSSVVGIDYPDDGRGIAVVDWDQDGDLDLWLSNRTGPRARMLRNDAARSTNYIAFSLEGTRCNRDAIGARVQIELSAATNSPGPRIRLKSLRAGEGFLSQSSKWIHFGLGNDLQIEAVKVFWPGQREPQVFAGLAANRRYHLIQGDSAARVISRGERPVVLAARPAFEAPSSDRARTILTRRYSFPEITVRDLATGARRTEKLRGPTLVNLWASWCAPCAQELAEFTAHEPSFREHGLRILAVSVDGQDATSTSTPTAAREVIERLGFPFEAVVTQEADLIQLTELTDAIFYSKRPLSLPCSFLIDADGKLAAFYRGPIDVEQLLADLDLLTADRAAILQAAFPFAGRRLLRTQEVSQLAAAIAYLEGDYLDLARESVLRHLEDVSATKDFEHLADLVSESMHPGVTRRHDSAQSRSESESHGRNLAAALEAEQRRLQKQGLHVLADIERRRGSLPELEQALTQRLRLDPEANQVRGELAVVLVQQRKAAAADKLLEELRQRATDDLAAQLVLGQTLMQIGRAAEAEHCFKTAVQMDPEDPEARFNLAIALQIREQLADAISHYRELLRLHPDHREAQNNLAWLYATSRDPKVRDTNEAVRIAGQLCHATQRQNPSYLDTFATALAANGDFRQAASVAAAAYELARGQGATDLATKLHQRIKRYQDNRID